MQVLLILEGYTLLLSLEGSMDGLDTIETLILK